MNREPIKEFSGRILGYIETKSNGDQVLTNFSGKILGYYRANTNQTTEFSGRIIGYGNMLMTLLPRD